ncbi:MAG: amidohydrolase family protein [Chitinophagaceae bacterium]
MGFRKFCADGLFDGRRLHAGGQALITTEEGIVEAIVPLSEAGEGIERLEGLLLPGFINCHCHLELSHMKGQIPEGTGLPDFVRRVMQEREHSIETIHASVAEAANDLLANGVMAVGDICNTDHTLSLKKESPLHFHNFIEVSGLSAAVANQRMQRATLLYRGFAGLTGPALRRQSITPHAPYSVSRTLWEKIVAFSDNRIMSLHNQESADEDELFLTGGGAFPPLFAGMGLDVSELQPTGHSSLQSNLLHFDRQQSLLLVHNTCTSAADVEWARRQTEAPGLWWCLCPLANLYISKALPDIWQLYRQGCRIVLGTDSLASNHQLSILAEINTIRTHEPRIPLEELLRWATLNGAEALQMEHLLGSFEPGRQPGVLLCSQDLSMVTRLQ